MSEYTPTPWETSDTDMPCPYRRAYEIRNEKGILAAMVQAPEDRDFIIRACNSHDDLLAALEGLMRHFDPSPYNEGFGSECGEGWQPVAVARAAIEKAKLPA